MVYTAHGTKDGVARVIRQQIGFWPLAEVGARGFMYDANSLYFDAKPLSRIVRIVVTLEPSDTYTVRVVNKKTHADIKTYENVYADQLGELFLNLPSAMQPPKR
jgi:hypothetical protein